MRAFAAVSESPSSSPRRFGVTDRKEGQRKGKEPSSASFAATTGKLARSKDDDEGRLEEPSLPLLGFAPLPGFRIVVLDSWFGLMQLARIGSGGASPYRPPVSR
jgi:hypothetical protein